MARPTRTARSSGLLPDEFRRKRWHDKDSEKKAVLAKWSYFLPMRDHKAKKEKPAPVRAELREPYTKDEGDELDTCRTDQQSHNTHRSSRGSSCISCECWLTTTT